jgi:hypothetical protein
MLISRLSIIISLIAIYVAIIIQHHLFTGYIVATGKTQALYGLKKLQYLEYLIIGMTSLVLSIISIFKRENVKTIILTLSLSILSILLLILDIWKLFL